MNYLFIYEDGLVEQRECDDISKYVESVAAGILEVIRVQKHKVDFESLEPDGSWKSLKIES